MDYLTEDALDRRPQLTFDGGYSRVLSESAVMSALVGKVNSNVLGGGHREDGSFLLRLRGNDARSGNS